LVRAPMPGGSSLMGFRLKNSCSKDSRRVTTCSHSHGCKASGGRSEIPNKQLLSVAHRRRQPLACVPGGAP
jgi:hypothetical protein